MSPEFYFSSVLHPIRRSHPFSERGSPEEGNWLLSLGANNPDPAGPPLHRSKLDLEPLQPVWTSLWLHPPASGRSHTRRRRRQLRRLCDQPRRICTFVCFLNFICFQILFFFQKVMIIYL